MQTKSFRHSQIRQELQVSPVPVLFSLTAVAILIAAFTGSMELLIQARPLLSARLTLYLVVIFGWIALLNNVQLAKWFLIVSLSLYGMGLALLVPMPMMLALLFLPVGLAAAMIGPGVGLASAAVLTVGMVAIFANDSAVFQPVYLGFGLISVWGAAGLMTAVYRPLFDIGDWVLEMYHKTLALREDMVNTRMELNQAVDDLLHSNRQLTLANEKQLAFRTMAEDAQKTKAAFVAKVSHEFRTPLNMIIGLVNLMIENPQIYGRSLPRAMFDDLNIIQRNCEHLTSMINDVLALSQAESGRLTLHRAYVDMGQIVEQALDVVQPLVKKKGLETKCSIPAGLSPVYCDRTRIRQVILNLVSNAARFTEAGGIYVQVEDSEQAIQVCVRDTGPGISPEDVERIFDPFCQGSSDQTWREKGGTGLGLTISKQFIELHGGRIWLESQSGQGAAFFFTLPKEHAGPVILPGRWINERWDWVARSGKPRFAAEALQKPRLVIYDPEKALEEVLVGYQNSVEYTLVPDLASLASDLKMVPANLVLINAPDLQTLDWTVEMARRSIRDTPVIGCVFSRQTLPVLEKGVVRSLVKPVTQQDLSAAVKELNRPVKHVLLVDNDLDIISLYTRMLENHVSALQISTATGGIEGLSLMKSRRPDLVMLDLSMPDMDGMTVLDIKSQDPEICDIPVIIISALDLRAMPLQTRLVMATMADGLGPTKLMECAVGLSEILLKPGMILGQAPG